MSQTSHPVDGVTTLLAAAAIQIDHISAAWRRNLDWPPSLHWVHHHHHHHHHQIMFMSSSYSSQSALITLQEFHVFGAPWGKLPGRLIAGRIWESTRVEVWWENKYESERILSLTCGWWHLFWDMSAYLGYWPAQWFLIDLCVWLYGVHSSSSVDHNLVTYISNCWQ